MASLGRSLPAPQHSSFAVEKIENSFLKEQPKSKIKKHPPYGKRKGFIPRTQTDFGDGGAFPEIHVAQYPLDMGRKDKPSNEIVPLATDESGQLRFDAIVKHGQGDGKIVYSRYEHLKEKKFNDEELSKPSEDDEKETIEKTKSALQDLVNSKLNVAYKHLKDSSGDKQPTFIRYTSSKQSSSGTGQQRVVRMYEVPQDPLEPPRFARKKAPRGPPSPPVPVLHSPPKKLTQADQRAWKIPPCISNWKNPKGHTIPLDKRLAADGRGLQQVQVNNNFAKLSEAMLQAERVTREEVKLRKELHERQVDLQNRAKDEELKAMAHSVLREDLESEKSRKIQPEEEEESDTSIQSEYEEDQDEDEEGFREREKLREERRRERERKRRRARMGGRKAKGDRDEDRDVTEKIALGQSATRSKDTMFDARLFNQSEGLDSGFGHDDSYNVYDKPLFGATSASQIYKPNMKSDMFDEEEDAEELRNKLDTSRFRPNKGFSGTGKTDKTSGTKPVEFEADEDSDKEDDVFALSNYLSTDRKGGARKAIDKIGKRGQMSASAGSSQGID